MRAAVRLVGVPLEIEVVQVGEPLGDIAPGRLDARAGAAAYAYLTHAIDLAQLIVD